MTAEARPRSTGDGPGREVGDAGDPGERPVFELFEGFALTSVLASLEQAGLLARLEGGDVPADPGEGEDGLPLATLRYLAQRGVVEEHAGAYSLTARGRAICADKGYLVWLAGGYGEVLAQLGAFSTGTLCYGEDGDVVRRGRWVADGSALIGRGDVTPYAIELLDGIAFSHAVDLGCGTGRFLIGAAQRYGASGLGVDLSPEACADAERAIAAAGLEGRVRVRHGDAAQLDAIPTLDEAQLVVAFFLLHEIFEQGRPALVSYLRRLSRLTPAGAHMLVAEVQPASGAPDERWRPEFTLLHAVMRQQLLTAEGWNDAFAEAGWTPRVTRDVDLPGAVVLLYENTTEGSG